MNFSEVGSNHSKSSSKKGSFRLEDSLSEEGLKALVDSGLPAFVPDAYNELLDHRKKVEADLDNEDKTALEKLREELREQNALIINVLCAELAAYVSGTTK